MAISNLVDDYDNDVDDENYDVDDNDIDDDHNNDVDNVDDVDNDDNDVDDEQVELYLQAVQFLFATLKFAPLKKPSASLAADHTDCSHCNCTCTAGKGTKCQHLSILPKLSCRSVLRHSWEAQWESCFHFALPTKL